MANPAAPELVILDKQNATNITEIVQISLPLCLQLIEQLRQRRNKKFFEITVILPDSSRVTFDIATIAKSSEKQKPKAEEIEGKIVSYSDKKKNFLFQKKGSKVEKVTIPSINNEVRKQLLSHLLNKETITLRAFPTIEYIGGTQKIKAYQFKEIITPQGIFNFESSDHEVAP